MLEGKSYCPLLHARGAEIKALLQLPAASKDLLFPLIVARPWPNAKYIARTWEKVEEALGGRRFALDLDPTKYGVPSHRPAGAEFDRFFDPSNAFAAYYDLVNSISNAVPVLRLGAGDVDQLEGQLAHVDRIDQGLFLRVEYQRTPLATIETVLARFPETVVFIDAGWSRELLLRQAWASRLVEHIISLNDHTEIVVCGSSFPEQFKEFGARGDIAVDERRLYAAIRQRYNQPTLVYGDWGSTRPPKDPAPMRFVERIDLPLSERWLSFRAENESYSEIASRVMIDREWPADLDIWGTYVIECTADDLPNAIRSPAAAAAARINIHLHRQANFGASILASDESEPFIDE